MALKRDANFYRQLFAAGAARRHFAQHGLGGQLGKRQRLLGFGQKALQFAAQRVGAGALKQRRSGRIKHRDAPVLVDTNDGVQRRVDDRFKAALTGVELLVALAQL